jgi:hypothetical protein
MVPRAREEGREDRVEERERKRRLQGGPSIS